jgi:hypothetical protein
MLSIKSANTMWLGDTGHNSKIVSSSCMEILSSKDAVCQKLHCPLTKDFLFSKNCPNYCQILKTLLEPYNIVRYYTYNWGAYQRHLDPDKREIGKCNTQKIERKNLNFRTWIKRLNRKTCASQNWNYCMIPLSGYSSTRSSLGLIFLRNYRFNPLPPFVTSLQLALNPASPNV